MKNWIPHSVQTVHMPVRHRTTECLPAQQKVGAYSCEEEHCNGKLKFAVLNIGKVCCQHQACDTAHMNRMGKMKFNLSHLLTPGLMRFLPMIRCSLPADRHHIFRGRVQIVLVFDKLVEYEKMDCFLYAYSLHRTNDFSCSSRAWKYWWVYHYPLFYLSLIHI